jgi:hypothetical protein
MEVEIVERVVARAQAYASRVMGAERSMEKSALTATGKDEHRARFAMARVLAAFATGQASCQIDL